MIKPGNSGHVESTGRYVTGNNVVTWKSKASLTLDYRQQDHDDEEEEGDVKDDAIDLVLVSRRVLDLVADASARPDAHVHVEHVALVTDEQGLFNTLSHKLLLYV